jgi:putative effector of murein hydrolase
MAGSVLLSIVLLVPIIMMLKSMRKDYNKEIESLAVMLVYLVVYNLACVYTYTFNIANNCKTIQLPCYALYQ